jgi:hypothetical protein
MCQSQTAQLTATQRATADQQTEHLPIFAFFIVGLVVFDLVALAKQMRQQKATHPSLPHHATSKQQPQGSSLFGIDFGFIHDLFSFHGFTPRFVK